MSASLNWVAWNSLIALPNCFRWVAWRTAASYAPCAIPTARAAMESRPPSRICRHWMRPLPSAPIRFSDGTRQPSKTTSEVSLALIPSVFSLRPGRKPGMPFSRMKADIPCGPPFDRRVTAMATHTSA